jgi:nuclear pore complex protein Nup98-Nup96
MQSRASKHSKRPSGLILPKSMTTNTSPPKNWPSTIPYLSTVHLDSSLTESQIAAFRPSTLPSCTSNQEIYSIPTLCQYSPSSNPLVTITPITDPQHPAYGQSGLFAARTLSSGTHILDYTGSLHSCPLPGLISPCATSDYDLAFLSRDLSLAIDSAKMGNEARFINDYHGIAETANAVFEEYFTKVKVKGRECWEGRMGIWVDPRAESGIAKGEEVCVSYGRGYWRARRGLGEGWTEMDTGEMHGRQ